MASAASRLLFAAEAFAAATFAPGRLAAACPFARALNGAFVFNSSRTFRSAVRMRRRSAFFSSTVSLANSFGSMMVCGSTSKSSTNSSSPNRAMSYACANASDFFVISTRLIASSTIRRASSGEASRAISRKTSFA